MEQSYTVTEEQLALAFNEWMARYEEDPENFTIYSEVQNYGEAASKYLIKILMDIGEV